MMQHERMAWVDHELLALKRDTSPQALTASAELRTTADAAGLQEIQLYVQFEFSKDYYLWFVLSREKQMGMVLNEMIVSFQQMKLDKNFATPQLRSILTNEFCKLFAFGSILQFPRVLKSSCLFLFHRQCQTSRRCRISTSFGLCQNIAFFLEQKFPSPRISDQCRHILLQAHGIPLFLFPFLSYHLCWTDDFLQGHAGLPCPRAAAFGGSQCKQRYPTMATTYKFVFPHCSILYISRIALPTTKNLQNQKYGRRDVPFSCCGVWIVCNLMQQLNLLPAFHKFTSPKDSLVCIPLNSTFSLLFDKCIIWKQPAEIK